MRKQLFVEYGYEILKYTITILYVMGVLKIWEDAPKYLAEIDWIFNLVIASILLYFFNPLKKTECTPFHRRVVFSAALAIILQSSLMKYINLRGIISNASKIIIPNN